MERVKYFFPLRFTLLLVTARHSKNGAKYSRMDQGNFFLLGPFFNTLPQMPVQNKSKTLTPSYQIRGQGMVFRIRNQ